MIDYTDLLNALEKSALKPWAKLLPEQIAKGLSHQRYGDLAQWLEDANKLPDVTIDIATEGTTGTAKVDYTLKDEVRIGKPDDLSEEQQITLEQSLRALSPWRKGPFNIFGVDINTEWRSDWKWDRLLPHIAPLENRNILDVGCGNGYHCWRMIGEQARRVIGIDPSPRFVVQFYMLKKYLPHLPIDVLPVGIQDLPDNLNAFDTTFSMGVLYHRRSPIDHLKELRSTLKTGGELVLETLIVEGDENTCLVPQGRYAQMNNVWFLPSAKALINWLTKCGFENVRCVNSEYTSTEEQRATDWMGYQSLSDFLSTDDPKLTIEGHPAPLRGIFIANRKN